MSLEEASRLAAESQTLIESRHVAADAKFETFDFGSSNVVEDAEGWEYFNDGDEMTRTVYFENAENPEADSQRGHFTVRFEDGTDAIAEAYGTLGGAILDDLRVTSSPRS